MLFSSLPYLSSRNSISLRAIPSPLSKTKTLFRPTVDSDDKNTPINVHQTPTARPRSVCGKKSPYPTVAIVMTHHHNEFDQLKFFNLEI